MAATPTGRSEPAQQHQEHSTLGQQAAEALSLGKRLGEEVGKELERLEVRRSVGRERSPERSLREELEKEGVGRRPKRSL